MLVSVIVITYNSSKYVLQTLESIKNQTYQNIELIISDDCSPDNTFEICEEWVNKNSDRFVSSKIVKTDKNGGICHNYNNGLSYAKGEWIKYIAGDDILMPDCIEEYVMATKAYDDKFIWAKQSQFTNEGKHYGIKPVDPFPFNSLNLSDKDRIKIQTLSLIRRGTYLTGPTIFLERDTLIKLGGFQEEYPFIEDYPLAMKYLQNGYPIGFIDKPLIKYRVYPESVSNSDKRFSDSIFRAIDDYCIPLSLKYNKFALWYNLKVSSLIRNHQVSKPFGYLLRIPDWINWKKRFLTKINYNPS